MNVLDYSEIKQLYVLGDIHGDFKQLFNRIKENLEHSSQDEPHPKEIERKAKKKAKQERFRELQREDEVRIHEDNIVQRLHREEEGINEVVGGYDGDIILKATMPNDMFKHKRRAQYNDSVIIVAGDCGFGFNKLEYYTTMFKKINECLYKNNCHLLFVRGNHDDPKYFSEGLIDMCNIKTILDYTVVKVKDKNILCVGGGLSVDRKWRMEQEDIMNRFVKHNRKQLYWDGEMPNISEEEIKLIHDSNLPIDMVITHTAPDFSYPKTKDSSLFWLDKDKDLVSDIAIERQSLTRLYNLLKENGNEVKVWFYGHFHEDYEELWGDTLFKLCNCNLRINNAFETLNKMLKNKAYGEVLDGKSQSLCNQLYAKLNSSSIRMTHTISLAESLQGVELLRSIHTNQSPFALFDVETMGHGNIYTDLGETRTNETIISREDEAPF